MHVYIAADHAGFELKEKVKVMLKDLGYTVSDEGAYEYNETDDYPDFIKMVAKQVACDQEGLGIVFGGSGQGEAIVANRLPGVRAVVYYGGPDEIITLSRTHNDSNVLSIGARFVDGDEALSAVRLWLNTPFSGDERHVRRISKIDIDPDEIYDF